MVFGLLGCPVFIYQVVRFNGATVNDLYVNYPRKPVHKDETIYKRKIV
jgi:hypothetical protein